MPCWRSATPWAMPAPRPVRRRTHSGGFTYLGKVIDHDVTARTDREHGASRISQADGRPRPITPLTPAAVVSTAKNGRRPQLDLDSLYGDRPPLVAESDTEAAALYDPATGKLELQDLGGGLVDVVRDGHTARIGDGRNDENGNISQLHAAFAAFHNKVVDPVGGAPSPVRRYAKARQIVRWTYQYIVAHDYRTRVCDADVVDEVVRNGPYFFGPGTGGQQLFMPIEFSVAGFRFGHSMIRPWYRLGNSTEKTIEAILGVSAAREPADDLLEAAGGQWRLKDENRIRWAGFLEFRAKPAPQMARRIDPLIAKGLLDLPFEGASGPAAMIRHLAQRNLCRGYLLSVPTGQAIAAAMGIVPLLEADLTDGEPASGRAASRCRAARSRLARWPT